MIRRDGSKSEKGEQTDRKGQRLMDMKALEKEEKKEEEEEQEKGRETKAAGSFQ